MYCEGTYYFLQLKYLRQCHPRSPSMSHMGTGDILAWKWYQLSNTIREKVSAVHSMHYAHSLYIMAICFHLVPFDVTHSLGLVYDLPLASYLTLKNIGNKSHVARGNRVQSKQSTPKLCLYFANH